MMLEDTLIYNPPYAPPFATLATAGLEGDGLVFFLRMTGDIGTVAAETRRPSDAADLADLLLTALVATAAARVAAWRQFYRGVRALVSGFAPNVPNGAFIRLRQFVRENADLTFGS